METWRGRSPRLRAGRKPPLQQIEDSLLGRPLFERKHLEVEYDRKPQEAHLYDIVLNISLLDLDSAVEVICFMLQQKVKLLSVKTDELGPSVGLSPYPGQPVDFRPTER